MFAAVQSAEAPVRYQTYIGGKWGGGAGGGVFESEDPFLGECWALVPRYKNSGFGRENGQHAIDKYLQTKSVWINTALDTPNPFSVR